MQRSLVASECWQVPCQGGTQLLGTRRTVLSRCLPVGEKTKVKKPSKNQTMYLLELRWQVQYHDHLGLGRLLLFLFLTTPLLKNCEALSRNLHPTYSQAMASSSQLTFSCTLITTYHPILHLNGNLTEACKTLGAAPPGQHSPHRTRPQWGFQHKGEDCFTDQASH